MRHITAGSVTAPPFAFPYGGQGGAHGVAVRPYLMNGHKLQIFLVRYEKDKCTYTCLCE